MRMNLTSDENDLDLSDKNNENDPDLSDKTLTSVIKTNENDPDLR